jgi:dCTP deaminase
MTVLSDTTLRARLASTTTQRIVVEPLAPDAVRPASYDVRLGETLLIRSGTRHVDPLVDDADQWSPAAWVDEAKTSWWLWPNVPYLGTTLEWIEVPDDLACQLQGISSLGRLGVSIHVTAGFVDPGWAGRITLEITVLCPTVLRPGMRIGQLVFIALDQACEVGYGDVSRNSKYFRDDKPTTSRAYEDALGSPTEGGSDVRP